MARKAPVRDSVRANVRRGVTLGRTPNVVAPMRPREDEVRASCATGHPRATRSAQRSASGGTAASECGSLGRKKGEERAGARTLDEDAVNGTDECPDVARPVGVVEPPLEGEQAGQDLPDLRRSSGEQERAERQRADGPDDEAELDDAVDLELCGRADALELARARRG